MGNGEISDIRGRKRRSCKRIVQKPF